MQIREIRKIRGSRLVKAVAAVIRLTTRLAELSESEGMSAAPRELYEAVRRELELIRRIQGQHAMALARRSTHLTQLRALWSLLTAAVDAERADGQVLVAAVDRVRRFCAELSRDGNTE